MKTSGIQIGARDRIFVAVVVPLVLAGAYLHFVRIPRARACAALLAEQRRLPDPETFPNERRQLERRVAEARQGLQSLREEKPSAPLVRNVGEMTAAARQEAALAVFTAKGGRIVRVTDAGNAGRDEAARGRDVLQRAGACAEPVARTILLKADYPAFTSALGALADDHAAVIPESVSLEVDRQTCRWEVTLWL